MGPKPKRNQEEKPPPGGGDSDTPYPESQSLRKNPPYPRKSKTAPAEDSGGEEEKADLEKIGAEALETFEHEASEAWVQPQPEAKAQARFRIHVARRIQKFGGLEVWKDLLMRAKQTKWMQGVELGLDFFISERSVPKMLAGGYGLPRPQPKTEPVQHDLAEKPWLALLPDLEELIRQVPYSAFQDAFYEAQNKKIGFGAHARAWAVWKILCPEAYDTWWAAQA